jgi:hypothetical protein
VSFIDQHALMWQGAFGAPRPDFTDIENEVDSAISGNFASRTLSRTVSAGMGHWTVEIAFRMVNEHSVAKGAKHGKSTTSVESARTAAKSHEQTSEKTTSAEVSLGEEGVAGGKVSHESKDVDTHKNEHGSSAGLKSEQEQDLSREEHEATIVADIKLSCDWQTLEDAGFWSLTGMPSVQNRHQEAETHAPNVAVIRFWRNTGMYGGE